MTKLLIAALAGSLAMAPAAFAGHKNGRYDDSRYYSQYERTDPRYGSPRYPGNAQPYPGSSQRYGESDYAEVVEARPLYRDVRVSEPRQECWDEPVDHRRNAGYVLDNGTAGALFGAVAGGVAGHQFGKGRGNDAATVIGALIGAGIGQRVAVEQDARNYETRYEQRCRTINDTRMEQRIDGYDVTYRYNGRLYHTRTPHDPGNRIPVRVDVQPVSY